MITPMVLSVLVGCGVPEDPEGTLAHVRGGVLDVGILEDPPWVEVDDGVVRGVDAELVAELAAELDAEVVFVTRGDVLEALEHHELDLVVGQLDEKDPWKHRVSFTRPYYTDTICVGSKCPRKHRRVWAVPLGENGMLVEVERFLLDREQQIAERVARAR